MPYLEHIDIWAGLQMSALHKIILNISQADLASQLELDSSAVNRQDRWGRTPLFWAVSRNDCTTVGLLLQWDADVHIAADDGSQPLHVAARNGCVNCVSMLLDRGASARCTDLFGGTPLHELINAPDGHIEVAALLLSHDVEIDAENVYGHTPLAAAIRKGNRQLTLKLLEHGADIERRPRDTGQSAIMTAILWDRPQAVRALIERGARMDLLNYGGSSVLHLAAGYGGVEVMNVLTDAHIQDVDVNGRDIFGWTPLEYFETYRTDYYAGVADLDAERPHFERLLASVQEIWYDCEE
ncbi:hypothetical protein H2199_008029 [Coniosporium tulheliwenetii]|nr:hypothetical protein H2199_008029 [Cladosporium sp. JES 115]